MLCIVVVTDGRPSRIGGLKKALPTEFGIDTIMNIIGPATKRLWACDDVGRQWLEFQVVCQ